ncbi:MAG: peptidylprolyl isomerase, partial [Ignavibacteria bacterium]|nr:peptidylprolyl isomerase [Ignavibacteria bacterium]
HGIKPVSENQLTLRADMLEEGKYSEPFSHSSGFSIVKLIKKHPASQKTFEEAQPEVSGGLQEIESKRLEQEYIEHLRTKYKPKIYYEKIEKAFTD